MTDRVQIIGRCCCPTASIAPSCPVHGRACSNRAADVLAEAKQRVIDLPAAWTTTVLGDRTKHPTLVSRYDVLLMLEGLTDVIPNSAAAIPGAATGANPLTHATPNRVLELEDDEEQRIVVGALEQYADTKRYTVAASTAHRKMLDRQGAIAKSLAQRLT